MADSDEHAIAVSSGAVHFPVLCRMYRCTGLGDGFVARLQYKTLSVSDSLCTMTHPCNRLLFALTVLLSACTYDPPPIVDLPLPSLGLFELGQPLVIEFSEPIQPETLSVRVWPARPEDKNVEDEFLPGVIPVLDACGVNSECSNATLQMNEDRRSAELVLLDDRFAEAKFPWVLEVLPGLKDDAGRKTGAAYWFDFQFSPAIPGGADSTDGGPAVEVDWDSGLYLLHAQIEEPFKVPLNMALDIQSDGFGAFILGGVKLTAVDGAPKNTTNLSELEVDTTDQGFGVFTSGSITIDGDSRFLATEAFDVDIAISSIKIQLSGMRLTGAVVPEPSTGADRVEGTLTFAGLSLDFGTGDPVTYNGDNTDFFMARIDAAETPVGSGTLCGEPCGEVTSQCTPPEDFPIADYCSANRTGGADTSDESDQ